MESTQRCHCGAPCGVEDETCEGPVNAIDIMDDGDGSGMQDVHRCRKHAEEY